MDNQSNDAVEWGLVDVIAPVAMALSILMVLSLSTQVRQILRTGFSDQFAFAPYAAIVLNAALAAYFGYHISDNVVTLVNTLALGIGVFYVYVYVTRSKIQTQLRRTCFGVFAVVSGVIFMSHFLSFDNATIFLGVLSNITTVIVFASPLSEAAETIRTKNSSTLSMPLAAASFLCSVSWSLYGMLTHNAFVVLPNVLGALLALFQLGLLYAYPQTKAMAGDITKDPNGMPIIAP